MRMQENSSPSEAGRAGILPPSAFMFYSGPQWIGQVPRTLERAHLYWVHWFSCKFHPSAFTEMPEIMCSLISGLTCDLLMLTHKINPHMKQLLGWGFPGNSDSKGSVCNARDSSSIRGSERSPGEGKGRPLQCSCLRSLAGYSPWGRKELDTTEQLTLSHFWSSSIEWDLKGCAEGKSHQTSIWPTMEQVLIWRAMSICWWGKRWCRPPSRASSVSMM